MITMTETYEYSHGHVVALWRWATDAAENDGPSSVDVTGVCTDGALFWTGERTPAGWVCRGDEGREGLILKENNLLPWWCFEYDSLVSRVRGHDDCEVVSNGSAHA